MNANTCTLCTTPGGTEIWRDDRLRIIQVNDPDYPGFCRVIWNAHVQEMSDLAAADQAYLMETVFKVERALRCTMQPDKINLASLGNQVPHLHWHVIPRYRDDRHFPDPIWALPVPKNEAQESRQVRHAERQAKALALIAQLRALFYAGSSDQNASVITSGEG